MFWNRSLVDHDTADWVSEGFEWLIETYGPSAYFDSTVLVLPTQEFFASPRGDTHEIALAVFEEVKGHMGMSGWPCRLIRQEAQLDTHVGIGLSVQDVAPSPGGSFSGDGGGVVITYNPGLMKRPVSFLYMLSHELSHFLLAEHVENAPGGEDAHEIMTDLTAIYSGFGVIQLEGGMAASGFSGALEAGWQIGNLGYLSSEIRAYALAVFVLSRNVDPQLAVNHLSPDKNRLYQKGLKSLQRDPERINKLVSKR